MKKRTVGSSVDHHDLPQKNWRNVYQHKKNEIAGKGDAEKLALIKAQLDAKHNDQVQKKNQALVNTFGSILLMVNYQDSQLIDRLGGGSLGCVDIQDDVVAFIMGYSESVQGHGVRYLCEYGLMQGENIATTGAMTYRGAYASETDHRENAFSEIKILAVEDDCVTFGVQSGRQLLIREWNTTQKQFTTLERFDLVEEQRVAEREKLAKTLEGNRKENLEGIAKVLANETVERENVAEPLVTDTYAIFPVVMYDRNYDGSDVSYKLYVVGDNTPKPVLLHNARCKYNPPRSGRFFRNSARFSLQQTDKGITVHIDYIHGGEHSRYKIAEEDVVLTLPAVKKST